MMSATKTFLVGWSVRDLSWDQSDHPEKNRGEFCRAVNSVSCMASVNGLAKLQYIVASQLLLVGQTWSKQSRIDMTFHDLVKHVTIWRVRSLDIAGRQEENYWFGLVWRYASWFHSMVYHHLPHQMSILWDTSPNIPIWFDLFPRNDTWMAFVFLTLG